MKKSVNIIGIKIIVVVAFVFAFNFCDAVECVLDIPLYEGPEKVADKSLANRKISVVGKGWIKSRNNSFLELDGKNDCILIQGDDLKLKDLTFSLWLKPYPNNEYKQCVFKGAWGGSGLYGYVLLLKKHGSDYQAVLDISFGGKKIKNFSFGIIPANEFTHLAFTYNHKNISLYKNGKKVSAFVENRDINYSESNSQLRFGRGYGKRFKGIIGGIKIFAEGVDDKFIASLVKENKEIFKNLSAPKQAHSTHVLLGSDSIAVTNKQNLNSRKTLLIEYRFNSDRGLKIKDYSPFNNDAEIKGAEWLDVAEWQKGNGLIISSHGAHIPGSSSITPEKFSLQMEIKPLQVKYAEIFNLFISPFYLKDRTLTWKNKENFFYPLYNILSVQFVGKNKIRVMMSMKNKDDKLVRKTFTTQLGLAIDKLSKVIITFNGKELIVAIDGKKQVFAVEGQLDYAPPQLYPGHVNAFLGGNSAVEYKSFKLYSLDNMYTLKHKYAIKMKTPHYLNFFTPDEPKTIDVGISSFYDTIRNGVVSVKCTDHEGKEIYQSSFNATLKPMRENNFKIVIPNKTCGCFWLDCDLIENGKIVAKCSNQYSVGAIRSCTDFPDDSPFGFCDTTVFRERYADFGEKWVRVSIYWVHLEPQEGKFDFSNLDKIINHHLRQNRKIYLMFSSKAPEWITGKVKHGFISPDNENHFKHYEKMVREVLGRYKEKISGYDVLGEANAHECFRKSPSFYARIAEILHKVKNEIDPEAFISGPSAWKGGWDQPTEHFLKAGAGKYWDRLDTHYIGGSKGFYFVPEDSVLGTIKGSREMMSKYGLKLPIIDGETGYVYCNRRAEDGRPMSKSQLQKAISLQEPFTTHSQYTPSPVKTAKSSKDELTGAQFTVRRMILCLSEGINLHLRFFPMYYISEVNPRYGKGYYTGVLLPGIAWTTMIRKLSWAKYVRKINLANNKTYGYLFYDRKNKKFLAVLWSSDKKQMVYINPDSAKPELFDIWGNPKKCDFVKKNLILELSESPVYLENVGKNIAEAENLLTVSLPKIILPQERSKLIIGLNNSQKKPITWTVDLNAGQDVKCEKKHFTVELEPGEKQEVSAVFIPGEKKEGKLNIEIKLKSTEYGKIIRNVSTLIKKRPTTVRKSANKITIDGDKSDWPKDGQSLFLGDQNQVKHGLNCLDPTHRNPKRDWMGPEDLSGNFQLCWDQNNIYLLAEVTDPERNILRSGNRIRATDGFEMFLDGRNSNEQGKDPFDILKGVRHIFISPGEKKSTKALVRIKGPEGDKLASLIQATSKETAKGYIIEMKIPILKEYFPQLQLKNGSVIGFNLYLSDADKLPKPKSTIVWHGNLESNKKPSDFGQIILEEKK